MLQLNLFSTADADLYSKYLPCEVSITPVRNHLKISSKMRDYTDLINRYCPDLLEKIWDVAKTVFIASISLFLYWTNPSLFAIGFITGIIFDENVRKAIKKIKMIWVTQTWKSCLIGGIASFFSLPVSLAASSIFWGAYLGTRLTSEDEKPGKPLADGTG